MGNSEGGAVAAFRKCASTHPRSRRNPFHSEETHQEERAIPRKEALYQERRKFQLQLLPLARRKNKTLEEGRLKFELAHPEDDPEVINQAIKRHKVCLYHARGNVCPHQQASCLARQYGHSLWMLPTELDGRFIRLEAGRLQARVWSRHCAFG